MTARTVLLTKLPPALDDLLVALLGSRADLNIVRGAAGNLVEAAAAANAEIVVTAHGDPANLDTIDQVAGQAAKLLILAIAPDSSSAYLHQISCRTSKLADVSASGILGALTASKPTV